MSKRIAGFYALLLTTNACASQTSSGAATSDAATASRPATPRRDRNVITLEELSDPAIRAMNALDAIRALRPAFFNERGKSSQSNPEAGRVHASLNYNGVIALNDLRNIPAVSIIEIRYLDVAAAMNRFGGGANEGPVIVVRTQ